MGNSDTRIEALYLANAVMFRALLHVFVVNAGETTEQRAAFQKKLFDQIMKDLKNSSLPDDVVISSEEIVTGIFGIKLGRSQQN